MTDSKGAIYGFGYDFLNRKTSATYPIDAGDVVRTEHGPTTRPGT